MSQDAINIMQKLRNRADTKSRGWTAFKDSTVQGYEGAYHNHLDALKDVKKNIELDKERCWMVFTLFWTVNMAGATVVASALGDWAGRLLEGDDESKSIELAAELFDETRDGFSDITKDLIKHSKFDDKAERAKESRPWEPVVDDPFKYYLKIEKSLATLEGQVLSVLDDLVDRAKSWSAEDAEAVSLEFEASCPYMTLLPNDTGPKFVAAVQNAAEWTMWVEWGLARDVAWWREHNSDVSGNEMAMYDPMLDRLFQLGVSLRDVTRWDRVGSTVYNQDARVLDMMKFIEWAKNNKATRQKTWTRADLAKAHQLFGPQVHTQDQLRCSMQR